MSGLVATLVAGGGVMLAIVVMVWLTMRGGGGRVALWTAFAAGSALSLAGILWGVVIIAVKAGGDVLAAILNGLGGIG